MESVINTAYDNLFVHKKNFEEKDIAFIEFKSSLDIQIAQAIVDGKIEGKNETERKANVEIVFGVENKRLRSISKDVAEARLQLDLAEIEVSRMQALLRLAEIIAK
jgi:hypothetical protein